MSQDPVIQCFRDEFDRFFEAMIKQIEMCPDDLWTARAGGYIFWQHWFHVLMYIDVYVTDDQAPWTNRFPREVMLMTAEPKETMPKEELLALAQEKRTLAYEFMAGLTVADITRPMPALTERLGRPMTVQNALTGFVRHINYHLGCCASALRDRGVQGTY